MLKYFQIQIMYRIVLPVHKTRWFFIAVAATIASVLSATNGKKSMNCGYDVDMMFTPSALSNLDAP